MLENVKRRPISTDRMIKVSLMAVLGMLLMMVDFPLWFAPVFLKFDFSDVPALIGGFAMGPIYGILIQLVKNLLKFFILGSTTGGVGELANFVVGSIFVYIAASIYHRNKTKDSAIKGLICGTLIMAVSISIINYFIMFPFYARVFGMPLDKIVDMGMKLNKLVKDYKSLIIFSVLPFNLIKGILESMLTLLLYKKVKYILK